MTAWYIWEYVMPNVAINYYFLNTFNIVKNTVINHLDTLSLLNSDKEIVCFLLGN